MVEEWVFFAVLSAGGAGDDDDGGFFGVGAGDGVEHVQAADAVGDAGQADAVDAGVSVGGEAGAGLVGHGDVLDGGFVEPGEGGEGEVAGDAEGMAYAEGVEVGEEELAEGEMVGFGHRSLGSFCYFAWLMGRGERRRAVGGFGGLVSEGQGCW